MSFDSFGSAATRPDELAEAKLWRDALRGLAALVTDDARPACHPECPASPRPPRARVAGPRRAG
jgi:hypothetical protein